MHPVTYTSRTRVDNTTHIVQYPNLGAALDRTEFDIEANGETVEFVTISANDCCFDRAHVLTLLDVWCDPARIKRG